MKTNQRDPRVAAAGKPGLNGAGPDFGNDVAVLRKQAAAIKPQLYKKPEGMLRYPHLAAGVDCYPVLVDWDAIWGGMAYLIDGDPEPLKNSLLNLLDHVSPGGKGQRVLRPDRYGAPTFQNRPFFATGAFVLSRETGSSDWLPEESWRRLKADLEFWHRERIGEHGLAKWLNVDEGFADNGLGNWAWDENSVEATDLNAQLVIEHCAVAWIADERGDAEAASAHRGLAEALAERLRIALWHEEDGCFYSSYNSPERRELPYSIRCIHYTNLWPLWAGLATPGQAKRVIEKYVLSPDHFWSEHGIRSMSKSDIGYNNAVRGITVPMPPARGFRPTGPGINYRSSNWQGPIWSIVNHLVAGGLRRYGYAEEAGEVAARVTATMARGVRETGFFWENYDADTGMPLCGRNIGSWCLMMAHLGKHLEESEPWILKGLDLPAGSAVEKTTDDAPPPGPASKA